MSQNEYAYLSRTLKLVNAKMRVPEEDKLFIEGTQNALKADWIQLTDFERKSCAKFVDALMEIYPVVLEKHSA